MSGLLTLSPLSFRLLFPPLCVCGLFARPLGEPSTALSFIVFRRGAFDFIFPLVLSLSPDCDSSRRPRTSGSAHTPPCSRSAHATARQSVRARSVGTVATHTYRVQYIKNRTTLALHGGMGPMTLGSSTRKKGNGAHGQPLPLLGPRGRCSTCLSPHTRTHSWAPFTRELRAGLQLASEQRVLDLLPELVQRGGPGRVLLPHGAAGSAAAVEGGDEGPYPPTPVEG